MLYAVQAWRWRVDYNLQDDYKVNLSIIKMQASTTSKSAATIHWIFMSKKNGLCWAQLNHITRASAPQRAKINEKVHKPPWNHYIEWPVFSDIGLNCESQGEKGRTCKKYKILIGSRVFFFHFIHDLPFSPGHLLETEERFVSLFFNFSPLWAMPSRWQNLNNTIP